ncbi:MAG: hypothetical protein GX051_06490 [Clostridiales bacterium]|nr:hypothetical protein [Clostridiales bacterium]
MESYIGTEAYDLSLFEPQTVTSTAAVPGKQPAASPPLRQVKKKPQSHRQTRQEAAIYRRRMLKVLSVSLCMLTFVAAIIYTRVQADEAQREITRLQKNITAIQSENVRLSMELSSKVSMDKVESYAEDTLGMVKAENYQITYIDLSEGDEVVLSGGKKLQNASFFAKIKEKLAYIF